MASSKHSNVTSADVHIGGDSVTQVGSGTPISVLLDRPSRVRVISVKVHFNASVTTAEELTISSEDLINGSRCSFVYYTQDAQNLTDIIFTSDLYLASHERLTVAFPNTDALDWGVTVIYAEEHGG